MVSKIEIKTFDYTDGREFTEGQLRRDHRFSYMGSEDRRDLNGVNLIVIHSMYAKGKPDIFSPQACRDLLEEELGGVSAHFIIGREGDIWQMVELFRMAWHAGPDYNLKSVGVELIGTETSVFTDQQYESVVGLVGQLMAKLPIVRVTGHQQISDERTDPWNFDWARFWEMLDRER